MNILKKSNKYQKITYTCVMFSDILRIIPHNLDNFTISFRYQITPFCNFFIEMIFITFMYIIYAVPYDVIWK